MSSVRVPGTVYQRMSGRWAAVTSPVLDQTVGTRRRISLGTFETRQDGLNALAAFNADRATVEVSRQRLRKHLAYWIELVESQVEVGHLARRTASSYKQAIRLHIGPALGHHRLCELNHLVVHNWLTSLRVAKGLSDQTVVRLYRTLHRALADAPLDRNPAALPKHMRPVVRDKKEILRPTVDEIGEFLDHTAQCETSVYLHPLFRLAAVSGMRCGELAGLVWTDVELEAGMVSVERSLGVDDGEVFTKTPKSEAGKRLVGLDPQTVEVLRSHRVRLAEDRLRAGGDYEAHPLGLDLVFRVGSSGGLLRPDRVSRAFTREWGHTELRKGVTLHSLRHSMASMLVTEGFPLTEVAGRLGHSVEVLQRTYARDLNPKNREERMAEAISGLL